MKKWTMTEQEFIKEMTREDEYKDDFSEAGLKVLFKWCVEIHKRGTRLPIDVRWLCHEFTEYENVRAVLEDYTDYMDDYALDISAIEDCTTVLTTDDDTLILLSF